MTRVPNAEEMDDDIFLRHIDARHPELLNAKTARLQDHPHPHPQWVEPYRAAHNRSHTSAFYRAGNFTFDHEHMED